MDRVQAGVAVGLRRLGQIELGIGAVLVFFITGAVAAEVFWRYFLSSSLIWVEEAATMAFIWMTMLGAAAAMKMRRHIVVETFGRLLPEVGVLPMRLLIDAFVLLVAAFVAFNLIPIIEVQGRGLTVSLPINVPRSWGFAIPTLVVMISISLTQLWYIVDSAVIVARRRPAASAATILAE